MEKKSKSIGSLWTAGVTPTVVRRLTPVMNAGWRSQEMGSGAWGPDGAYTFQMTSQRGSNPVFHPGETLEVLFRTGRDSWLYCFYTDAKGQTVQLLPNPLQAGVPDANYYAGGSVHLFPDPARLPRPDPFDITITDETLGIEVFQCIATPEDVTGLLPGPLRGTSLDPIPTRYTARLREIFEEIVGRRTAEARMTVTVMEDP